MAQKARTFADLQTRQGIQTSELAIIVGAHHVGLVRALEMAADDRIEMILAHKKTPKYYNPKLFHKGYYGEFNHKRKRWNVKEFTEPRLRLPD